MDAIDRSIVNTLQDGFPICERPYAVAAERLGIDEQELLARLQRLLDDGVLSRFGPMYHAEKLGGGLTLAAMAVPERDFERVVAQVNALPQVAHNYARAHRLNLWFVLATETPAEIDAVVHMIERDTGLPVYNLPRIREL
ncbi:MAG: Lrp/AsnC family transcriptional regulator [Candidatus Competibacterales bacterium]|nr:Lrp/AsnC family transcriptional regulator [Candidatus Competibacterales bacterium]